jgi:hypothetical protein
MGDIRRLGSLLEGDVHRGEGSRAPFELVLGRRYSGVNIKGRKRKWH